MRSLRIPALVLAFVMLLGSFAAFAALPQPAAVQETSAVEPDQVVRVIVLFEGDPVPQAGEDGLMSSQGMSLLRKHRQTVAKICEDFPALEIAYDYTTLFSGVSGDLPYGALEELRKAPGVKDAWVATTYILPESMEPDPASGVAALEVSEDYTGQGTLIAILDTGANLSHQAFAAHGDMLGEVALRYYDPRLNSTSVTGAYVSKKIPFAYDYADRDSNATDMSGHGTHVAGLAAGWDPETDFSGQAPGAQLAIMKVFGDVGNTTSSDVYFAALQDAMILGADVINMSFGYPCGFTYDYTLDSALFGNIYRTLEETGIILCAAGGNSGSQGDYNSYINGTVLSSYTDYGTVASPATYLGNTSVAAAINTETKNYCVEVQGEFYSYYEPEGQEGSFISLLGGRTLEYVVVPGIGEDKDYEGIDVQGKIALVFRGELDFQSKIRIAAEHGAAGILIYNNVEGIVNMHAPNSPIPAASMIREEGLRLVEKAVKEMYILPELKVSANSQMQTAAYYSAWGTTPDLTIDPAITAVGDQVLSAGIEGSDHYVLDSGTSMASPNAAGQFAALLSGLMDQAPELTKPRRAELAESLAYSSANILGSETEPVSVRQQGVGLMNASAAMGSPIYIENPLQELGDDPGETGVYRMELEVNTRDHLNCPSEAFPDLDTGAWYHQGVDFALSKGLFVGSDNGTFMPSMALTRAMLVQVLYRIAGSPQVQAELPFTDVSSRDWYAAAVTWAYSTGVTSGTSSTTFSPNQSITRQDMVTMFHRYLGKPRGNGDLTVYQDLGALASYAADAAAWAVEQGIITSTSTGEQTLSPLMQASRAQFATILYRYYGEEGPQYETFAQVICDTPEVQEDGTVINLLKSQPLDCVVEFSCGETLEAKELPGTVTVTVTLTEAAKAMLRQNFENGTYVEGYVGFRLGESQVHATFLSFFGDWEEAPIVEPIDFRDVAQANYEISSQNSGATYFNLLPLNVDASMAYLYCSDYTSDYYDNTIALAGDNPFGAVAYSQDRICLSTGRGDADYTYAQQLLLQPVLLRNAVSLTYQITDANAGVVYTRERESYLTKSLYDEDLSQWLLGDDFYWSPWDEYGQRLVDGTELVVSVTASLRGETETLQWEFPCFIDSDAPTVEYSVTGDVLTIRIHDQGYISYVSVTDEYGNSLLEEYRADDQRGYTRIITLNTGDIVGDVIVTAVDYATNARMGQIPLW